MSTMKKSLQDQIAEAVASGKLNLNKPTPDSTKTGRRRIIRIPHCDLEIIKKLAILGRKKVYEDVNTFSSSMKDLGSFLKNVDQTKRMKTLSVTDIFFCLAAFAKSNKSEYLFNNQFRQHLTKSAFDIILLKLSDGDIKSQDSSAFDRVVEDVQDFINHKEINNAILYKLKTLLEKYSFSGADIFHRKCQKIIPSEVYDKLGATYDKLKERYRGKLSQEKLSGIELLLARFEFEKAESLYELNRDKIDLQSYKLLERRYLKLHLKEELSEFLKQRDYRKADHVARDSSLLSKHEYDELKSTFFKEDIKSIFKSPLTDDQALSVARSVVSNAPNLPNDFSLKKLNDFVINNIDRIAFPFEMYKQMISDIAEDIRDKTGGIDTETTFFIVVKFLSFPKTQDSDYNPIWSIFCASPRILERVCISRKDLLDTIADIYPYEHLKEIGKYYIPAEKYFVEFLKTSEIYDDKELCDFIRDSIDKNKYFNSQIVFSLLKAKNDAKRVTFNDIHDLLYKVISKSYDYHADDRTPIENLIFPKCISSDDYQGPSITDREMTFCEGYLWKEKKIVMCRNNKCDVRTDHINRKTRSEDNYFFGILREHFHISSDKRYEDKQFVREMGAFNRWNEIVERLFCGYGRTKGCGATLIYNRAYQVPPGFAAYPTTYWHCSNASCENHQESIKLSHCRGCGKIIDSRFDTQRCLRSDEKEFYICIRCGYCCAEHGVSGHCPKCNSVVWENIDNYDKIYRCKNCDHVIRIPSKLKNEAKDKLLKLKGYPENSFTQRQVKCNDKDLFDDIPF